MIKVHGAPLSPFVRKVLFTLEYKGLEYENDPVFPGSEDPAFRAISPLGKIPVLEHDDFSTPDSSVICRYLDQVFPERPIYPEDPREQARATWIEEFADTRLVEALGGLFQQNFLRPKLLGEATDEAQVRNIIENVLPPVLAYVESIVPEEGTLMGGGVSIADIAVVTCFIQGEYGDYHLSGDEYPRIRRYLDFALDADLVKQRLQSEKEALVQLGVG